MRWQAVCKSPFRVKINSEFWGTTAAAPQNFGIHQSTGAVDIVVAPHSVTFFFFCSDLRSPPAYQWERAQNGDVLYSVYRKRFRASKQRSWGCIAAALRMLVVSRFRRLNRRASQEERSISVTMSARYGSVSSYFCAVDPRGADVAMSENSE